MSKISVIGLVIILCGISMALIFNNNISTIFGGITIGIGIGVVLTGRYRNK